VFSWIKAIFYTHFGFSKAEAKGTLGLLLLTCLCLLVSQGLKWYHHRHPEVSHAPDIALLEHTLATLEARKQKAKQRTVTDPPHVARTFRPPRASSKGLPSFDINTTDEVQLCTIEGIGPVLAARIVKFRNKLGGFVSQAQCREVYGLPPDVVVRLQQATYIHADFQPVKLDINTADVQTLAVHPYITYQQARSIVSYRIQHGPFQAIEALSDLILIDQATLKKSTPYLSASPQSLPHN